MNTLQNAVLILFAASLAAAKCFSSGTASNDFIGHANVPTVCTQLQGLYLPGQSRDVCVTDGGNTWHFVVQNQGNTKSVVNYSECFQGLMHPIENCARYGGDQKHEQTDIYFKYTLFIPIFDSN